jgi:VanZ family protein
MLKSHATLAYSLTFAIGVSILIATLAAIPESNLTTNHDKSLHVFSFALLVLPLGFSRVHSALTIFIIAIVLGGTIELIQPVFGRSRELLDLVADGVGAAMGIALCIAIHAMRSR